MLVRRLTGYALATRFLITVDHGFIYTRDKLQESDKISPDKSSVSFVNKRFLLSEQPIVNDAMVTEAMKYPSNLNILYVTIPMGANPKATDRTMFRVDRHSRR